MLQFLQMHSGIRKVLVHRLDAVVWILVWPNSNLVTGLVLRVMLLSSSGPFSRGGPARAVLRTMPLEGSSQQRVAVKA